MGVLYGESIRLLDSYSNGCWELVDMGDIVWEEIAVTSCVSGVVVFCCFCVRRGGISKGKLLELIVLRLR